jgi:hypothetical protein
MQHYASPRQLIGGVDLVGGAPAYFGGGRVVIGADDQAAHDLQMRNATLVQDTAPQKSRRYPLGFPTTVISASGGTGTPSAQPQVLFRSERLIVPSDFAGALLLTDIKIGKNSQLAAANPLPARAFTEFGWGVDLYLDTADISQFVTLNITNNGAQQVTFNGMFIGRGAE